MAIAGLLARKARGMLPPLQETLAAAHLPPKCSISTAAPPLRTNGSMAAAAFHGGNAGGRMLGILAQDSCHCNRSPLMLDVLKQFPCGFGPSQLQQRRSFIQMKSKLTVADNTGAKVVECIKVLNKTRGARLGDKILASVKQALGRGKVKKGQIVRCVIVRARMPRARCDGSEVRFDDNAVVLINENGEPLGTRVNGPVSHELRRNKLVKVLSLAEHVA